MNSARDSRREQMVRRADRTITAAEGINLASYYEAHARRMSRRAVYQRQGTV